MKSIKIAFFDAKPYDKKSFSENNANYNFDIKFIKYHLNAETAVMAEGCNVVCAFVNDTISKEVVDILHEKGVKLIALRCAGFNNVDFSATYGKIHVVRVPAYSPYAVAEHAIALMMTLNRKTHKAYNRIRENNFSIDGLMGFDIHGKTVGVVGLGKIGQIFVKIINGFGVNVIAYDPFPNKDLGKELNFKYVELDELYKSSDIISLHCPLTSDTHHLINKDSLALMKKGVMLINTSRGALINTKDLIEALKDRKVGSAGLDVYEEEEKYFFEDFSTEVISDDVLARLLTFNNVLVTSHQAFFTYEALSNIANTTLDNIKTFANDELLKNEICYRCNGGGTCKRKETGKCF